MKQNKVKHLPQIEYYYDGYVYPFIGNADLKTLIEWRAHKLNSDSFWCYSTDARNTYFEHLWCIEKCCRILFSNPNSEFAMSELNKRQTQKRKNNQVSAEQVKFLLDKLNADEKKEISTLVNNFFK
jgi:hypothetical protein